MPSDLESIRRELVRLCRRKECRIEAWTRERPTKWQPDQVINPESGIPFTKAGAWEFIAQTLESGCLITEVEMRKPPNEVGYVVEVDLIAGSPRLYIKLQISRGKVIGRSFHYSLR